MRAGNNGFSWSGIKVSLCESRPSPRTQTAFFPFVFGEKTLVLLHSRIVCSPPESEDSERNGYWSYTRPFPPPKHKKEKSGLGTRLPLFCVLAMT